MSAGLVRLARILAFLIGSTELLSLAIGLLAGSSPARAVSLGFLLMGSFVFVAGAAIGMRGPARHVKTQEGRVLGVTHAPQRERLESINVSYLFVFIGIVLVVFGIVIAPNARLF